MHKISGYKTSKFAKERDNRLSLARINKRDSLSSLKYISKKYILTNARFRRLNHSVANVKNYYSQSKIVVMDNGKATSSYSEGGHYLYRWIKTIDDGLSYSRHSGTYIVQGGVEDENKY